MGSLSVTIFLTLTVLGCTTPYTIRREENNNSTIKREQIIGGFEIVEGHVPYHVSLKYDAEYMCGGALITYQHVVTAAHCILKSFLNPEKILTIVAGTINQKNGGLEVPASAVFIHPQYSSKIHINDIGVIKLLIPYKPGEYISTISLPKQPVINFEKVIITGFGRNNYNNLKMSTNMKMYSNDVLDNLTCFNLLPQAITKSDICEVVPVGHGICNGDSGSPLVNMQGEIVGVASRVVNCASGSPNIYSSVFYNLNFVKYCISQ